MDSFSSTTHNLKFLPGISAAKSVRIAIIPAIFDPRLNYLENVIASASHRQGHQIKVFTSEFGSQSQKLSSDSDDGLSFPVYRSKQVFRLRDTQLPYDRRVAGLIRDFSPDVAFVVAPLHGLGYAWIKNLPPSCRVVSAFSDLSCHRDSRVISTMIKKHWARSIIRRSCLVMAVTPETQDLLASWTNGHFQEKIRMTGLLVDLKKSACPEDLPTEVKALRPRVLSMGALITRVTPEKKLDEFFGQIEKFLEHVPEAGFVLAGLGDNEASERLRKRVADSGTRDRCVLLPMVNEKSIRAVFSAAEFSVWNSVSIGLYHSLASGCPAVLWSGQVSKHLIEDGANGFWFSCMDEATETMLKALQYPWDRQKVSASVEGADVGTMIASIIAEVTA